VSTLNAHDEVRPALLLVVRGASDINGFLSRHQIKQDRDAQDPTIDHPKLFGESPLEGRQLGFGRLPNEEIKELLPHVVVHGEIHDVEDMDDLCVPVTKLGRHHPVGSGPVVQDLPSRPETYIPDEPATRAHTSTQRDGREERNRGGTPWLGADTQTESGTSKTRGYPGWGLESKATVLKAMEGLAGHVGRRE
jgi:hypothetical protein